MTRTRQVWSLLGCLLLGTCVGAEVLAMLHYLNGPNGLNIDTLPYTPLLALTYLIFMLPTALVVGLPGYFFLKRLNWLNGWSVIALGTVAGAAWAIPAIGSKPLPYDLALFFGLGGFISAAVSWLAFVRSNSALNTDASGAGVG